MSCVWVLFFFSKCDVYCSSVYVLPKMADVLAHVLPRACSPSHRVVTECPTKHWFLGEAFTCLVQTRGIHLVCIEPHTKGPLNPTHGTFNLTLPLKNTKKLIRLVYIVPFAWNGSKTSGGTVRPNFQHASYNMKNYINPSPKTGRHSYKDCSTLLQLQSPWGTSNH